VKSAAGQLPHEPRIDRSKSKLTILSAIPCTGNIIEKPLDLACRKIGVNLKSRFGAYEFCVMLPNFTAYPGRPAVLPDDGVMNRFASLSVPDDGRFALIRDANSDNVGRLKTGFCEGINGGSCSTQPLCG